MKRIFSLTIAFLLLFTACAGTAPEELPVETETVIPVETPEETTREDIPDNLPERDFAGKAFRVISVADRTYETAVEEYTGTADNDALYDRNLRIAERFNCSIEAVSHVDPVVSAINTATAGTNDYELVSIVNYKSGKVITSKSLLNWYEIPFVNLEMPWYVKFINDSATIHDKIFTATGDMAVTSLTFTVGMFFNQKVCGDYGYTAEDLYEMVDNNSWTIDNFLQIIDAIYVDINGDGKDDINDLYGYGGSVFDDIDIWLPAFDHAVTGRDENGNLTLALNNEKTVSIVDKLVRLIHETQGSNVKGTWQAQEFFAQDLLAFAPIRFHDCFGTLRDMESEYSILPVPKWDEAQQDYRSTLTDEFSTYGMVKSVPEEDYEFVGILFEAMNAESYKTVFPVYCDIALKGKYATDLKTAEIMDRIISSRSFDAGFTFGAEVLGLVPYCVRDLVVKKSTDLASMLAQKENIVTKGLQSINETYS